MGKDLKRQAVTALLFGNRMSSIWGLHQLYKCHMLARISDPKSTWNCEPEQFARWLIT